MASEKKDNLEFHKLSKNDKSFLRKRIYSSIHSYKRRRRAVIFAMAASAAIVVTFISISFFNVNDSSSAIQKFAETQNDNSKGQEVQLLLNNNQNIAIPDTNAKISYSSSGEEVNIGHSNRIEQKATSSTEPIFNTLIVPFGKRSEIVLSDGSKVWLNSGSKLIFPAKFASEKREVYLEGEAIFEVNHNRNKPFFVKSKNHEIEVLGTVFNVSNYMDDSAIYTVLQSGSIKINYASNKLFNSEKNVIVKPGNMVTFNKANLDVQKTNVDVEQYFSWRDGVFIFKNDLLQDIVKKISRYYNIEISITDNKRAKETFSGYLDVNGSIESVLETIKATEPSGFEYQFATDGKIIVN